MNAIPDDELRKHVRNFLEEFKALILEKPLYVGDRVKNKDALIELGLTARQREEIILSLSVEDYCTGPIKDEFNPGYIWVFGKKFDGVEVYIKIKIALVAGEEYAKCFSFHKAEHTLNYPLA